ncbi:MAG: hypothetical protein Q4A16_08825 [Lautropia sp.]|nr:hypothetical protein [Lautropia sp.]
MKLAFESQKRKRIEDRPPTGAVILCSLSTAPSMSGRCGLGAGGEDRSGALGEQTLAGY